jgi:hypothetical protein
MKQEGLLLAFSFFITVIKRVKPRYKEKKKKKH